MKLMKTLSAGVAAMAITTAFVTVAPTPAMAQQTTSDLRGVVTDDSGAPIAGANVSVTDTRTGTTRTATTDSQGRFSARNLSTTGNYRVTASAGGFQSEAVDGIRLSLGDTAVVSIDLARSTGSDDEIVVVATRSSVADVAIGPSATFDFDDLQSTPAASRDIKDIIRVDPRLFIDESFGNGLQCAGASPRFNSLTVDGIKLNDNFGLNSNGYPTERLPFPFDAINQVAVELAPFDVEYGGFTGCNINAVTRTGSNEVHGSAWVDYTSDTFNGGSVNGSSFDKGDYSDFRYGATLGLPIIKDKLFFFGAFEQVNETAIIAQGPAEAGAFGVQGVSQAQLDRIMSIASTMYGYDVGTVPDSFGERDRKFLARLDWNINDFHRASFTYNRNNGNNLTPSDASPTEYEFFNHFYNRSTLLNSYSGQIFSDWSDNLSTELRASYTTNDTGQNSIGGTDFGEIQIRTRNNGQNATVYLGADDSRHSNKLDTKTFNVKFKADYTFNNNLFTFGFEREQVEVFNLFIQHTEGEYRFDRVSSPNADENIDDFENGLIDDIFYGNAGITNNPADGAANFKFATNTLFVQDTVDFDEINFSFTAGFRYDFYTSSDVPALNSDFLARNGFDNTSTFDGRGLLQPRFGFNWEPTERLSIHGGAGLFSGGNPNVWLSNSYQNDSRTTIQTYRGDVDSTVPGFWGNDEGGMDRPFYSVPNDQFAEVAMGAAANAGVNAIDPNFEIPSQWKVALGFAYEIGDGYMLQVDGIYSDDKDAATITDATLVQIGTAPDGRPIYRSVDKSDPDCATSPEDAGVCSGRSRNQDFILGNNDGGKSKVISAALSKDYEIAGGTRANWTLAYAYTDAKDRNPMTSSVAFSNFVNFSTTDPNNPSLANSNYEVPHRFTLRAGIDFPIFGNDLFTKFDLFGVMSQSRPYSIVFEDAGDLFGDGLDDRHLQYVPTGAGDPNVIFAPGFDTTGFFNVVSALGLDQYAGGVAPRNAFQSDWYSQWDLRIEQELPGLLDGHRAAAFVIIDNIGNLINDEWGVITQAGFPGRVQLASVNESIGCAQCAPGSALGPNGEYIFTDFNNVDPATIQSPITAASVWQIRFGLRYEF